jgi:hypothetical protein
LKGEKIMICLKCGSIEENLHQDDIIEEEFYGNKFISTVIGHCENCGAKYMWDKIYTYTGAEDCRLLED